MGGEEDCLRAEYKNNRQVDNKMKIEEIQKSTGVQNSYDRRITKYRV